MDPLLVPDDIKYVQTNEVMFYDTDCGGVVHNLAYLRMIEECRTKLGEKIGLSLRHMIDSQQFPVVVRHEIDYVKPGKLGDSIITTGWLSQIEKVKMWFNFEMRRAEDGLLLLKAHQLLALVQMPEGKPMRIPAEQREYWSKLLELASNS